MADQLKQALTRLFGIIVFAVLFYFVAKLPIPSDMSAETGTLILTISTIIGAIAGKGVADWFIKQFKIGIAN